MRTHSSRPCLQAQRRRRRHNRRSSIHPILVLYSNRVTHRCNLQHQAQHPQRQAALRAVSLRQGMKRPRVRPFDLSDPHRPQTRGRSITTTTTTTIGVACHWRLIPAVIWVVFAPMRGRFRVNTTAVIVIRMASRHWPRGGPATMIMHPVNLGGGVPDMEDSGGLPVITETDDGPLSSTGVELSALHKGRTKFANRTKTVNRSATRFRFFA
jgi:hypothetical protein